MKTENIKFDVKICMGLPYLKTLPLYCFNNSGYSRKSKFNNKVKDIKKATNYCFGGNNILNVSLYAGFFHNLSVGFYEYEVYGLKKYKADISIGDLFGYSLISIEVPLKNRLSKIDNESYSKLEKALRDYHSDYGSIKNICALNHMKKDKEIHLKNVVDCLLSKFDYV